MQLKFSLAMQFRNSKENDNPNPGRKPRRLQNEYNVWILRKCSWHQGIPDRQFISSLEKKIKAWPKFEPKKEKAKTKTYKK